MAHRQLLILLSQIGNPFFMGIPLARTPWKPHTLNGGLRGTVSTCGRGPVPQLLCSVCSTGWWALGMDLLALVTAYLIRATDSQEVHFGISHPITAQMTAVPHYVLWKHKPGCIFKSEIFKCRSMRCGLIYN